MVWVCVLVQALALALWEQRKDSGGMDMQALILSSSCMRMEALLQVLTSDCNNEKDTIGIQ